MTQNNDEVIVEQSGLYLSWLERVAKCYTILSIEIQSTDYKNVKGKSEVLFIKLKARLQDKHGHVMVRSYFLRHPTVAILPVLICEGIEYALLVKQARSAIGGLDYPELPAGIVEDEEKRQSAARELHEETGIQVSPRELLNLCELFYSDKWEGIYPSPGACNEIVHLFLYRKIVDRKTLESFQGRKTGLAEENEHITLEVVKLKDLCASTPDPKAHSAFVMYQTLCSKH